MIRRIGSLTLATLLAAGLTAAAVAQETPKPAPAPDRTAVAQPVKGQMMQQAEGTMLSTELVGANVRVGDQDKAGSVTDLVITPEGRVTAVVLGVGGFLGLGSRNIAINLEDVRIVKDGRKPTVQVSASKADLEKAPPFKTLADIQAEKDAAAARQQSPTGPTAAPRTTTAPDK